MDRRAFLVTAGTALSVATSGCQDDPGHTPHPEDIRLTELRYLNRDRVSYNLHILLLQDEDPVYWQSQKTDVGDMRDDGTTRAREGEFSGYPTEPAPYKMYARIDNDPRSEWVITDFQFFDRVSGNPEYTCYGIKLDIKDGQLDLLVSFDRDDEDC